MKIEVMQMNKRIPNGKCIIVLYSHHSKSIIYSFGRNNNDGFFPLPVFDDVSPLLFSQFNSCMHPLLFTDVSAFRFKKKNYREPYEKNVSSLQT